MDILAALPASLRRCGLLRQVFAASALMHPSSWSH